MIKLAKAVNPQAKKLVFFSWDAMKQINEWFKGEIEAACRAEKVELADFKLLPSIEDELQYLAGVEKLGREHFVIGGISAWVHRDGTYADLMIEEGDFIRTKNKRFPIYGYDEASIRAGYLGGTCIVWYDIGAQLGEKGFRVLKGEDPGSIPWDYPRKFNLMFNLKAAERIGMKIPQNLLGAAYRIYTDYDGNFIGKKN
jgi:putative ABC transport system substrate-binding protein